MKIQELASKSDADKKSQMLHGRSTQTGPKLGSFKREDDFQQISAENTPEILLSILTSSKVSNPINVSQEASMIKHLQKIYGNANIQRMIHAKLTIGKSNDRYEREADQMAEQVMQMPEPKSVISNEPSVGPEEEKKRSLEKTTTHHNTLAINANRSTKQSQAVVKDLESRISILRGRSQPLSESVRSFFEPRFGYDFSKVRIHNSQEAAEMAKGLNAKAFTLAQNIFFGKGRYAPNTRAGKMLLAHELEHIVQCRPVTLQFKEEPKPKADPWVSELEKKFDELSGKYPWIPGVIWRSLKKYARRGTISQPFWIEKFPVGEPNGWGDVIVRWREYLVAKPIGPGRFKHSTQPVLEAYQEFPESPEYYLKTYPGRFNTRTAGYAATAAKHWNIRIYEALSKNQLSSFETERDRLMNIDHLTLIFAFLRACVGASAAFYPIYK